MAIVGATIICPKCGQKLQLYWNGTEWVVKCGGQEHIIKNMK